MIWKEVVRRIANGLPVDESVTNVPIDDLTSRTDYLKELLEAFQAGRALTHQKAPLSADTFVGCVVYWDDANSCYAPALASYSELAGAVLGADETALALGVVIEKGSSLIGTVCLVGKIHDIDISSAIIGDIVPGIYYLTDNIALPGKLTSDRPPLGVPVLYLLSADEFWVSPLFRSSTFEHKHYSFFLDSDPISDASARGWLPADHAAFTGKTIPDGAVFGYNIEADSDLLSAWPPMPPEGALVIRDGLELPMGPCGGVVTVNRDGIWWLDDENILPWDNGGTSLPGSDSSLCHPNYGQLFIHFTGLSGLTDNLSVLSLTGESPVSIVDSSTGLPATTGNLTVKLDDYTEEATAAATHCVADLDRSTKIMTPVVSGIKADGLATASGSGSFVTESGTYHYGTVTITVDNTGDSREGFVDLVEINDVQQADYSGLVYLLMPSGRSSSIRCRFVVPTVNMPEAPMASIVLTVLGTGAGNLPALGITGRLLPDPGTSIGSLLLSDNLSIDDVEPSASQKPTTSWQYIKLVSDEFAVAAGDTVIFSVTRSASDGFAHDIGLFIPRWSIS